MNEPRGTDKGSDPYRVMVVDDSAVVRGLVTRMLEADSEIKVVASVSNGMMALNALGRYDVEVVVLDIEMPVMDGMTALPQLLKNDPNLQIIMASTLTTKNADISMRALEAGAADYLPKPTSSRDLAGGPDFQRDLVAKIKVWGQARRRKVPQGAKVRPAAYAGPATGPATGSGHAAAAAPATGAGRAAPAAHTGPAAAKPAPTITLRQPSAEAPDVLAIGSSTGGPQALFALMSALGSDFRLPILITQHMPATFTTILAEHVGRMAGRPCSEAKDGAVVEPGHIYVAPGDFHMVVEAHGPQRQLRLNKNPPENFCRPSVDPMLRSVAKVYGRRALVTILTGMGADGMKGGQDIVAAGGTVIAQDEASSVVWGMPGAVATAGLCSAVLPLKDLAPYIRKLAVRR